MTSPDDDQGKYAAGFAAGRISTRLDSLEAHTVVANGHLTELSAWSVEFRKEVRQALNDVRLELARLSQDAIAKDARVLAAADAVESARVSTARQVAEVKERSEVVMVPWGRIFAIITAVLVAIGIVVAIIQAING